ncbi:thymidylate kinase [Verrucomicrobium sp. GAS474]|uniref:dTMP kinase n=1 Tax=Verrucomicrobium sp. GAS474 TaxID=1882831 RepID=UPI00087D6D17|nr:dTMP kinase [Verrucomicrobium sp. GAS474]SDU17376.1 thymidylate kinase [Verrucomicrobium sp. GAS474]
MNRLITFEGSEGCGKTTQISLLKEKLETRGETVLVTREPGGTPLGEKIRHLLKDAPEGKGMTDATELLLFSASRAELVTKVIAPALKEGAWVLCDRFTDSTFVYQGIARELPIEFISTLNLFATGDLVPGLTLLLEVSPAKAAERMAHRATRDRIEDEEPEFFDIVREGFVTLAESEPDRIKRINADADPGTVAEIIWTHFLHAFPA